jgi:hypothetical protein
MRFLSPCARAVVEVVEARQGIKASGAGGKAQAAPGL